MSKLLKITVIAAAALFASVSFAGKIKVACVGDSITYGYGIKDGTKTYPQQLGRLLGDKYEVENFGVSGTTALQKGNSPYMATLKYRQSLNFQPKIVVIKLGTNDSKAVNIAHIDEFKSDVKKLIASYEKLCSKPKNYLCLPIPSTLKGVRPLMINGDRIVNEIIPLLKKVAADSKSVTLIDLFSVYPAKDELLPDKIHPNAEGAGIIADTVAKAILSDKRP